MNARDVAAGVLLAAALGAQAAAPEDLRFEQAFAADDGSAPLHYRAEYVAGGAGHQVEVWVDRGARLVRRTDDALEIHAERKAGDDEFRMTVLDLRRRIATRVDRTNLYRIGHASDWFALAQGLQHPRGEYRLARSAAPDHAPQAVQSCEWYALAQAGTTTRICWSTASRVPLLIVSPQGVAVWRVTEVDRRPVAAQRFEVRDAGFVRNDANGDIEGD